jgi:hypothetical protein
MPKDSSIPSGITRYLNKGSFSDQIQNILTLKSDDVLVSELDDDEYVMLRPIFKKCGVNFQVVLNIPDFDSPRSFLYEEDPEHVISFDMLKIVEKTDAEKFLDSLNIEQEDIEDDEIID